MWRYRIITFMAYPPLLGTSKGILLKEGGMVLELGEKERVFAVRKVYYDDDMTPMYANPVEYEERRYSTLQKLKENITSEHYVYAFDSPILDLDHSLKVYEP